MNKVYRAIDKTDGDWALFLVKANGDLYACICWPNWSDEDQVNLIKRAQCTLALLPPRRFLDAVNPVLIGKF